MPVSLTKKFRFEAAHWLPMFPEGHKCKRLHGHSFEIEIVISGEINPNSGVLLDFADVKKIVKPYIDSLDHYCLNDLGEQWNEDLLKNPTSENMAKWFWKTIKPQLPELSEIVVHETCTSKCVYWE